MQSLGEERNTYRHSLPWLVQYGTGGKCPSFYGKHFFMTFLNFKFMIMSIFNSTVQSIPCPSNNTRQARQCRHLNHNQAVKTLAYACKIIRSCVCSAKNKEKRMEFKCHHVPRYEGYPESKDTTRVGGEEKSPQTIPLTAQTSLAAISICFSI
jgi:hypothetical protein